MRIGIALGSNIGDRLARLRRAHELIAAAPEFQPPLLRSAIYESSPVDMPAGTPPFLNAVLETECRLAPREVLEVLIRIERQMGRPVRRPRNLSRAIDLDLLYQDGETLMSAELILPHPRMLQRGFVLRPLADIRPDLVLPGQERPVAGLLTKLPAGDEVVRTNLKWK